MAKKWVHNITTGELTEIDLTSEEIQQREAERLQAEAVEAVDEAARQAEAADLRLLRQVDNALAQIAAHKAEIAGETTPANLAQLWSVVQRQLQREQAALTREEAELKVLARLARRALNE